MSRAYSSIIRLLPHLAAIGVVLMYARLAVWQFDRAEEKAQLLQSWERAEAITLGEAVPAQASYARVEARGGIDQQRNVLLDNQMRSGRPGVHVFTPFQPEGANRSWLVNRGWHSLSSRQQALPKVDSPAGPVTIAGRLARPPRVGLELGKAQPLDPDHWPNLVTYLDLD